MPSFAEDIPLIINGVESSLLAVTDPLARCAVISLFTWKRARPEDDAGGDLWGWWGDNVADVDNDQIGSWLWLLARVAIRSDTPTRAEGYAVDALKHLIEDGVATSVTAAATRIGLNELGLIVTIYRVDGPTLELRFANVWSLLNV